MLHLADRRLAPRQIIARGRVAERITGRGLPDLTGTLSFRAGAAPLRPLPVRFLPRREGFFAFSLIPERDMPNLAAAASVVLRAEYRSAGSAPILAERTVAGSALAFAEVPRSVAGQTLSVRVVAGAPFDLSAEIDPVPVALAGIVLRDHDVAEPIAGVTVAAGAASTVTDAAGRFFLPVLPLAAEVSLTLTEGTTVTAVPFRIDYARPVNRATLSLPS